jgi:hypothetical protein
MPCQPDCFAVAAASVGPPVTALGVTAALAIPTPETSTAAVPRATVKFRNFFVVVMGRTLFSVVVDIDPDNYPRSGTASTTA